MLSVFLSKVVLLLKLMAVDNSQSQDDSATFLSRMVVVISETERLLRFLLFCHSAHFFKRSSKSRGSLTWKNKLKMSVPFANIF